MPPPLIKSEDVGTWLGSTLSDAELEQVEQLIKYASARLRHLVPNLDARVEQWTSEPGAEGSLDPDLVTGAMTVAVARAFDVTRYGRVKSEEYPEVKTTYVESGPDLSAIYFTDDELGDLLIEGGKREAKRPHWQFC